MTDRTRIPFAHLPTPIHRLPRLSKTLNGPEIWVKRDDQTGLAFGGNKTRKLELLVGQAQVEGAQVLLTRGARQSNHCRQTAAAAAHAGIACTLVLTGEPPDEASANLLLDHLLGAEIVWSGADDPEATLQRAYQEKVEAGENAFLIPYGGSNPLGASAYADAMKELSAQGQLFDRIIFATSSGGTQAGMLAGARLYGIEAIIDGISVDKPTGTLAPAVAELATAVLELLGSSAEIDSSEVLVDDRFLGGGYAVMGSLEREAIRFFARTEGLLLDPVYTGRAAGGMLSKIRNGEISTDEKVLFWHTGGTPALFAYGESLLNE
jgi:L-cysteate sulfo-lyase